MPELASERELFCVVHNIPKSFRARDLRRFFSQLVEAGAFSCFHYRHRPEVQLASPGSGVPAGSSETAAPSGEATSRESSDATCGPFASLLADETQSDRVSVSRRGPHPACCSPLKLHSRSALRRLLKLYHNKHWVDGSGAYLARRCFISELAVSSKTAQRLATMIELRPPVDMPAGNVGTPTAYFLEQIQRCKLPASLVKRLGLVFPRQARRRQYSAVPMDYGTRLLTPSEEQEEEEMARTARGKELLDRLPGVIAASADREKSAPPAPRASDETDAEETDRHEALHDDVTSQERSKERLYEEEIELVWEKGGPGLVWYTDAVYWDSQKGDFDERTADDWDVDMSGYEDGGRHTDRDSRQAHEMRQELRLRRGLDDDSVFQRRESAGVKSRLATTTSDSDEERESNPGFWQHTRGFGRRLLLNLGWSEGGGLGSSGQGIRRPVSPSGQVDRRGFGFAGEPLLRGPDPKKRRRPQPDEDWTVITTAFDKPGESELRESADVAVPPTHMKFRRAEAR